MVDIHDEVDAYLRGYEAGRSMAHADIDSFPPQIRAAHKFLTGQPVTEEEIHLLEALAADEAAEEDR